MWLRRRFFKINGNKLEIDIYFQPIVNLASKKVFGFEALARGFDIKNNSLIPPNVLFSSGKKAGILVELDRCCKELAIMKFVDYGLHKDYLLFINIEPELIDQGKAGTNWIKKKAHYYGVDPFNLVAEIKEGKVNNFANLTNFVKAYKDYGIHIALDDFGLENSNLYRLLILEPSFFKVDRELIQNLKIGDRKFALLQVCDYISRKFGCIPIAEGVETVDEVKAVLQTEIIFYQGFFFAKPHPDPIRAKELAEEKMKTLEVSLNGKDSFYLHGELGKEPDCRGVCQAFGKTI
jgi:EAL domain-containing protein (putative c-di-GMP-specific phosphodiesterase class I)